MRHAGIGCLGQLFVAALTAGSGLLIAYCRIFTSGLAGIRASILRSKSGVPGVSEAFAEQQTDQISYKGVRIMRLIVRFLTATIFGAVSFASSAPLFAQQGYVHEVAGNVFGQVGSGQSARVEKGQTLPAGSSVTTEQKSYAVLKFEDGTVVLLKENTTFQVQAYSFNPKAPESSNAVFNLVRGGLRLVTGLVTARNRDALRVATPLATMGIRGTDVTAELVNPLFVAVH